MQLITSDKGFIIINATNNTYYCGLSTFDKQLRKAKIYHSIRYAQEAINSFKDKQSTYIIKECIIQLI